VNANKMAQEMVKVDVLPRIVGGPESVRSVNKFLTSVAGQISKVMDQVGKAAFDKKTIQRMDEQLKDLGQRLVNARTAGDKEREKALQEQFNLEKKNIKDLISYRKKGSAIAKGDAKVWGEAPSKVGETIGKEVGAAFSDVISGDIGNIGDMFKRLGGFAKKGGGLLQSKQTDDTGLPVKLLGGFLKKLGPILLITGAIAAAFAAIVKFAIDADTKMKELANSLIQGGAAAGDFASNSRELVSTLNKVAVFAQDQTFNELWGTLPEDQAKLLGAWSEAGFTLKEMRTQIKGAATDQQAYQKATAAALTYSKLLGESADSVAAGMAERMEDLGLSLEGVRKNYASVYDAAQLSGFGTKRFFGMVLQATSGMSMYNVRMEEAAGLMLSFTKILGAKTGDQFFQSMTSGFKDKSIQDRVKAVKLMGAQFKEIAAKEMSKAGTDVMGKLSSDFGTEFKRGGEALAAFGMEMGMSQDLLKKIAKGGPAGRAAQKQLGDMLAKSMAKMTPEEYTNALANVKMFVKDPKLITEIEKLYRTTRGMSDNIVEQARALASWGPGGVMAGKLAIAMNKANKPLEQITGETLLGIHELAGLSEDEAEQMAMVFRAASGGFNKLESIQNSGQKITEQLNKELADKHGMAFKDGKKYSAILKDGNVIFKDEINNVQDAVMALGGAVADIPNAEEKHRETALSVAKNTLTISTRIQQYLEQVLGDISRLLQEIRDKLPGGESKKEREDKSTVRKLMAAQAKDIAERKKGKKGAELEAIEQEERVNRALTKTSGMVTKEGWFDKDVVEQIRAAEKKTLSIMKPTVKASSGMMGGIEGLGNVDPEDLPEIQKHSRVLYGPEAVKKVSAEVKAKFVKILGERVQKMAAEMEGKGKTRPEIEEAQAGIAETTARERAVEEATRLQGMFMSEHKKLVQQMAQQAITDYKDTLRVEGAQMLRDLESEGAGTGGKAKETTVKEGDTNLRFEFPAGDPAAMKRNMENAAKVAAKKTRNKK